MVFDQDFLPFIRIFIKLIDADRPKMVSLPAKQAGDITDIRMPANKPTAADLPNGVSDQGCNCNLVGLTLFQQTPI